MTIDERRVGDVTILELRGRLLYNEGDLPLRTRVTDLVTDGRIRIVVDLRDVTAMDSCGVGELVARLVSVRQHGGDIKLVHLTSRTHKVMAISRLLGVFRTFESETEAVASFTPVGD